jgi:iron complex outermembrane recepter protein
MTIKLFLCASAMAFALAAPGLAATPQTIIITGTSAKNRTVETSVAPATVIGIETLNRQADSALTDLLRTALPSYNVNTQPILDAATLIRPANLRGLSPDHTLVLIGGKRMHRAGVITFLGNGVSDGAQGPDISTIPALALSRVEVLRDGASTRYGSDAVAGVIHLVPAERRKGGVITAKAGQTYSGDGDFHELAGQWGTDLDGRGFFTVTGETGQTGATDRSVQRADAAALIAAGNTAVENPAQRWGRPETRDSLKLFINSGWNIAPNAELYGMASYAARRTTGGFFFRNPIDHGGVYEGPLVDPLTGEPDAGGVPSILVGNLGADPCPAGIPLTAGGGLLPDPTLLALVQARADCFSFYEEFPGGFTPRFGGELEDGSATLGIRGALNDALRYDVSVRRGINEINFQLDQSVNASLGPQSPNRFSPGGYRQEETLISGHVFVEPATARGIDPLITLGAERREERFTIIAGDAASYAQGPLAGQGFSGNANGFAGFQPRHAGSDEQTSHAFFTELDLTLFNDRLTLQTGIRYEDLDAFGDRVNGQIGARFEVTPNWHLRTTLSNGFHAPTAGQANVVNVTTALDAAGNLVEEGTFPLLSVPGQLIADYVAGDIASGGLGEVRPVLRSEEALSLSIGTALDAGPVRITLDGWQIDLEDRLARSSRLDFMAALTHLATVNGYTPGARDTRGLITELGAQGLLDPADYAGFEDVQRFSFFGNAFDTRTQGIDLAAQIPLELLPDTETALNVVVNYTRTEVTRATAAIDEGRIANMEGSLPNWRAAATLSHAMGRFDGFVRLNYFGEYFEDHLGAFPFLPINGEAQWTVDAEMSLTLTDKARFALGASNLFDTDPSENPWDFITGPQYPPTAPAGFEGGQVYAALRLNW